EDRERAARVKFRASVQPGADCRRSNRIYSSPEHLLETPHAYPHGSSMEGAEGEIVLGRDYLGKSVPWPLKIERAGGRFMLSRRIPRWLRQIRSLLRSPEA